jgi:hypothetical protein
VRQTVEIGCRDSQKFFASFPFAGVIQIRFRGCYLSPQVFLADTPNDMRSAEVGENARPNIKSKLRKIPQIRYTLSVCGERLLYDLHHFSFRRRL